MLRQLWPCDAPCGKFTVDYYGETHRLDGALFVCQTCGASYDANYRLVTPGKPSERRVDERPTRTYARRHLIRDI